MCWDLRRRAQQVRFGANRNTTAPRWDVCVPGRGGYATLRRSGEPGWWTLIDKQATAYVFGADGRLVSVRTISEGNGHGV